MATPILSLHDVSKSFGSFVAVDAVQLEVQQGEIFGFLGPNGAGKSTTIRLILDILRPTSGQVRLFGLPNRQVLQTHRDLGYLSGDMALDNDLTGSQYLEFVHALHGGKHHGTISRLSTILEADLSKRIGEYSRGNRQKIGLIAAMLHNPKLLILDEPTSGFDPLIQEKFAELIREYVYEGGTVFMSSHVLAEVQHLCDKVAFINDGRIVATKTVKELLDTKAKRVTFSAPPPEIARIAKAAEKLKGLVLSDKSPESISYTYSGDMQPLLKFAASHKLGDISIREPELDEVFGQYYEAADHD